MTRLTAIIMAANALRSVGRRRDRAGKGDVQHQSQRRRTGQTKANWRRFRIGKRRRVPRIIRATTRRIREVQTGSAPQS